MSASLIKLFQVKHTQNEEYTDATSLGIIRLMSQRKSGPGEGISLTNEINQLRLTSLMALTSNDHILPAQDGSITMSTKSSQGGRTG